MSDLIHVNNLLLRGIIGINDDERINKQDIVLSFTLRTDTRAAAASDGIEDTVNYRSLTKQIIELVETTRYFLVEKLAEEVAELCLADERVESVVVTVEKPGAVRFAQSVGVTIERTNRDA